MYIVVVAAIVFSLIIAGLSTVDWGSLFADDAEPTPDYNTSSIAAQQTVVAQNPDDADSQALLASMLGTSGRMQEAIPVYERALELAPDNADIRLDFARSLQSHGMDQDAEAQFLLVLDQDPDNHTAHYYLARLYLGWQPARREEAIQHLQRVVEIAPNSFLGQQAQDVLGTMSASTPLASPAATP